MKQLSIIRVGFLSTLLVMVASCGLPLYSTDEYYEEAMVRRDVYRGSIYGSDPIIYERDPYTGRYYEVNPYGAYARPTHPYYDRRGNRYYPNSRYDNNRPYNPNGRFNNNPRNYSFRNYPQAQQPQRTPQTSQEAQKDRDEARERILGSKRN